nr:IncF plasmid conjugative transfer pilus assembly protein TraF [Escherichia coli]
MKYFPAMMLVDPKQGVRLLSYGFISQDDSQTIPERLKILTQF